MSLGQNVVAQSTGPDDTLAMGPAPTVNVPFSWSDPTSIYLWMENDSVITGLPNWLLYVGTGLTLFSLLSNRHPRHRSRKKH